MKRTIQYKLLFYFLLVPFLAIANSAEVNYKSTKEKTISKSFAVNKNATLEVSNSFGNINVISWNENKIDFEISIKVSGNNDEKIEERLDGIDVEFKSSSDLVSAITNIEKNKSNWWNWGKKMNLKMEIDYVIKVPMSNNVFLQNRFGAIVLDKLEGDVKINCEHGKITTKELLSSNNEIKMSHTKDSYFEYIKSGEISASHSRLTISNSDNIALKGQHSQISIENTKNIGFKCQHGSLKVDKVNTIEGKAQHLTMRIGELLSKADLNTAHGSLKISMMTPNVKEVDIESQFTGITIGYNNAASFNFDLDFQFGSLRDSEGFVFRNKESNMHNKKYKGYYGTENSGNIVRIDSQHGSVSFKQK
ncbi:MAG: hypothetical protein Wins2KO_10860 [Winogradskyella sp.]